MVGVLEAPQEKDDEIAALLEKSQPKMIVGNQEMQERMPGGIGIGAWEPTPAKAAGLQPVGTRITLGASQTPAGFATPSRAIPQSVLATPAVTYSAPATEGTGLLTKLGELVFGWN